MTGEMCYIDQDGRDDDGNIWEAHAAVAKAVGGTLKPFDQYQGPYIAVGPDLVAGKRPYAHPVRLPGIVRLWLVNDDSGMWAVYREDTDELSPVFPPFDTELAVAAAKALLSKEREV